MQMSMFGTGSGLRRREIAQADDRIYQPVDNKNGEPICRREDGLDPY
jgi:hypothetical protein